MKIVIIGGGAAGCFAAANITHPKAEIIILERSSKLLQKVKVSGGGRCNVTHHCFEVPELLKAYPRGKNLLKKSLHHFTPEHTIDWFNQRGAPLKVENDGRMFPITDDSQTIIDVLIKDMNKNGVKVRFQQQVESIKKRTNHFFITSKNRHTVEADRIIVCTGGYPKPEQYQWLKDTTHLIEPPVPSLFTFNLPQHPITQLMGVSVPNARIKILGTKLENTGPVLITHWGLSGPGILKLSALAAKELATKSYNCNFLINWVGKTEEEVRDAFAYHRSTYGKSLLINHQPLELPKRLWHFFLQLSGITESQNYGSLTSLQQNQLVQKVCAFTFEMQGKTTYKEEFVTCGGIEVQQVNPQTMESKIWPGLYFAGEVLNVDGVTGGFNFQHAWNSAWLAAQHINSLVD